MVLQVQSIASRPGVSSVKQGAGLLCNVVEPGELIDNFLLNPPIGFQAQAIALGAQNFPAFLADFDLLTTLDQEGKAVRDFVQRMPFFKRFIKYPALFVGTTATEYANYPELVDYAPMIKSLLERFRQCGAQLLIVKDIPCASPLLSKEENEAADRLIACCDRSGFSIVAGQALAYVPIDFTDVDQFLGRMSRTRRKDFRRKLRESAGVQVEELKSGDEAFFDEQFLATVYKMYLNVYEQSEIHFDLLSPAFFRTMLQDRSNNGRIFVYKSAGKMIGYNICFVHNQMLVDKYVGFLYPEARDANLYFLSWFYNLEYALKQGLKTYIAGWTDPAVKASLGANFTLTKHAVYVKNPLLRTVLKRFQYLFESDQSWVSGQESK